MPKKSAKSPRSKSKKSASKKSSPRSNLLPLALTAALLLIAAYFAYVQFAVRSDDLADLFELLEAQDFTPNPALSPLYLPGNVIQTAEAGPDGTAAPLASPLPFLWAEDCFPDLEPRSDLFALPESERQAKAALSLGAETLHRLFPQLALADESAAKARLEIERPYVLTFTRPELSRQFAPPCVTALRQTLDDGDRLEWFEVVVQAVVADGLRYELEWSSETSAEARAEAREEAKRALEAGKAEVEVSADTTSKTVLEAAGRLVLGYRTRPLEKPPALDDDRSGTSTDVPDEVKSFSGRLALRLLDGRQVGVDHPFQTGEFFRFEITSSHDGWLYVFHRPPGDGALDLLWPRPDEDGGANAIQVRQTVLLPPGEEAFQFTDETGEEYFYVALVARPESARPDNAPDPVEEVENFLVRGLHDSLVPESGRGVSISRPNASGSNDLHVSFQARDHDGSDEAGLIAAVEFQLRHEAR